MQQQFNDLADHVGSLLAPGEIFTASFQGEDSDFVRFNAARVRQATHVQQRWIGIDLIEGSRHACGGMTLSGVPDEDRARVASLVAQLREQRAVMPEDPHLLVATEPRSTARVLENRLPDAREAVADIQRSAGKRDLVGIYAAGDIHVGFASSYGQRNWSSASSFNFDWSCYHAGDKAVKSSHAGFDWHADALDRKMEESGEHLRVLAQPARTLSPGRYRVYLAPAALRDVVEMISSESFGLKAQRTKQSPLMKMYEEGARLSSHLTLQEATAEGLAPNFQEAGFLRPDRVTLLEAGVPREPLVSPRSAREYGVPANGASAGEAPESLAVGVGRLPSQDVLRELGTGVWVGNVWYLNYSDRSNCRTTGMTRFATFWVENGVIQAPIDVMRFDETAYRMLGENLVGLTDQAEWLLDPSTYGGRSLGSARVPGAIVEDFSFTL